MIMHIVRQKREERRMEEEGRKGRGMRHEKV
jgi:hypothetical protein